MSKFPDRQTSVLTDETGGSYRNVMQPDTTSGGRLLSASEDSRGDPQIRMTRSARRRVRLILIVMLVVILATMITVIAILSTGTVQSPTFEEVDQSKPLPISSQHVRCKDDVIISAEDTHQNWRHYDKNSRHWQQIPNVRHTGFVLISPRQKLEAGYPGVLISMQLPGNNTRFHVMAVSTNFKIHSKSVILRSGSKKCDSVAIDDRRFFTGNETIFRIYIYYVSHFRLHDVKFTVTSLAPFPRFQRLTLDEPVMETKPKFAELHAGERAHCSLELYDGAPTCNWWNMVDGDGADFIPDDGTNCVTGGIRTQRSAIYYLGLELNGTKHETRSLLVSPIIIRETSVVLLTLWNMYKCSGTRLLIHRIPATNPLTQQAIGASTKIAEVTERPIHQKWKFESFEIPLPENHTAYQIVIEGIIEPDWNCSSDLCGWSSRRSGKQPLKPYIGLDSLALEPIYDKCHPSNGSDIMNCGFQTNDSAKTMCEWLSSVPEGTLHLVESGRISRDTIADWRIESSGGGDTHGATEQHLEGRGFILSFDASGKYDEEGYVRTPLMIALDNCSCKMSFLYLMRGVYTPRMQVNVIYGENTHDESRNKEPQWSLLGHQDDDWLLAVVTINLLKGYPFQIEIRVTQITEGIADVHFDDMEFVGCAMKKYKPPSSG